MKQVVWIFFAAILFTVGGCIDLEQKVGEPCSAERSCETGADPVCGANGTIYACAELARCEEISIDPSGEACDDLPDPPVCHNDFQCRNLCPDGYKKDADGCDTCECKDVVVCAELDCTNDCPSGYKTDENGCDTCQCNDVAICNTRHCANDCLDGYKTDENGCDTCECKDAPPETCEEDECVSYYCASPRGKCIRESELATMGACPESAYQEPAPQCVCGDEGCAAAACGQDADCGDGICVHPAADEPTGYCVTATCEDISQIYQNLRPEFRECRQDSDCWLAQIRPQCCGGIYVNSEGAQVVEEIDNFAAKTSCGQDWAQTCMTVRCAPPRGMPSCIEGACQMGAPR